MTRPRVPLLVVAVVAPAALSIVAIIVALVYLPDGEIAVHWRSDGTADGFAPAWTVVLGMAGLAVVGPLVLGIPLLALRTEGPSATQKLLAAVALWFAVYMSALGLWIVLGQQEARADVPPVWEGLLIAFGSALVIAAVGWWLSPATVPVSDSAVPAEPLRLASTQRAVWIGRTRLATPAIVAISTAIVGALAAAVLAVVVTDGVLWLPLLVPVVLVVVLLSTSSWNLRADERGLVVGSAVGWPRFGVPADDIERAGTTTVAPVGEFGGWGIRLGSGRRTGIVMRSGEALEVRRRDGRTLVVTVDDAGTAAALLQAVATRQSSGMGGVRR